jgi:hypothetical protein
MIRFTTGISLSALGVLAALGTAGCVPQTRFEWGNYEPSLYQYYKSPSDRAQYEKSLTQAIASGRKSNRIAPGLCAELGYMKLEDGNVAAAQSSFDEEMRLFPESRPFLAGVTKRMTPTAGTKDPVS